MLCASTTQYEDDGIARDDWDALFDAVAVTLRQCAHEASALAVHATVEHCVQSLELLRAALGHERGYLRQIEIQLQETSAALDIARTALSESRAGELRAHNLSQHDSLTELPNRSQFRRRLEDGIASRDASDEHAAAHDPQCGDGEERSTSPAACESSAARACAPR